MFKQAIVLRTDLKMGKGKLAAECAHASLLALKQAPRTAESAWQSSGFKKIVLRAASEKELLAIYAKARHARLPCALVRDAGLTQIARGTAAAVGIGPAQEERVDEVTGRLKLL